MEADPIQPGISALAGNPCGIVSGAPFICVEIKEFSSKALSSGILLINLSEPKGGVSKPPNAT